MAERRLKLTVENVDGSPVQMQVDVETHRPGTDIWARERSQPIADDKTAEFETQLLEGQRVVISPVGVVETLVFDPVQMAAIRPSAQTREDGRADEPMPEAPEVKDRGRDAQPQRDATQGNAAQLTRDAKPAAPSGEAQPQGLVGARTASTPSGLPTPGPRDRDNRK